jgi:hypothetical protein
MESHDRDQFDQWLDGALRQYGNVEPRVGLEGRVLARLAAGQISRTRGRWIWALTVVSAGVLVSSMWFGYRSEINPRNEASERPPREIAVLPTTAPPIERKASRHERFPPRLTHQSSRGRLAREPKLQQFPSPRPISKQEMMLVEYVERYPQEAILIAKEQDEFQKRVAQAEREIEDGSNSYQKEK